MNYTRRNFLKAAGSGIALTAVSCWRNGGYLCYGAIGDNSYYHSITTPQWEGGSATPSTPAMRRPR